MEGKDIQVCHNIVITSASASINETNNTATNDDQANNDTAAESSTNSKSTTSSSAISGNTHIKHFADFDVDGDSPTTTTTSSNPNNVNNHAVKLDGATSNSFGD